MPQAPAGTRGYTDFQRIDNWDGDVLYSHGSQNIVGSEQTSVFDVSRFAYMQIFDVFSAGDCQFGVTWYNDNAKDLSLGTRVFNMTSNITHGIQARIPHLGPWAQLSWFPMGAGPTTHSVAVLSTNRTHPLEFIPQNPVLVSRQNIALAAGANDTVYPSDYYAGPVAAWLETPAASWVLQFQQLDSTDTWQPMATFTPPQGDINSVVVTPPGAWRVVVHNGAAGAGNYDLAVVHTTTGGT